jgi:ribosomal-protein-alanine N-acetyltransferase
MTDAMLNGRLESVRVSLRRLTSDDAPALFRSVGDPTVMRYWCPGPDPDVAHTVERIAEIEYHWQTHGFGDWGVVSKADGELIGFAGLHHIADMDEVNIGYVLQRDRWRQGLGHEIAQFVLGYGFGQLSLAEVVAVVDPRNAASIRLVRKCGLALRRRIVWMKRERLVYGVSLAEWQATRSGAPV